MSRTPTNPRGPSLLVIFGGAAALGLGLAGYMRFQQAEVTRGVNAVRGHGAADPRVAAPAPPQVANIRVAVQAMQLVTVQIDTTVTVHARDESWRGDVDATITVPVRLFFGTDFSKARVETLRLGPALDAYSVTLPKPARIATEAFPEMEDASVRTGWLRFRAMAGEYALGLARRSIGEEARRMVLRPEDQEMVREQTRRRVTELVRAIVGEGAKVTVEFRDEAAEAAGEAAGEDGAGTRAATAAGAVR